MLVYKYRSGTEDDLRAIENNQFWSSSIGQLNDPSEATTDTKWLKKIFKKIGQRVGAESKEDFDLINENADDVLSMDNNMGIYSLSRTPLDELLWAHYANAHRGFCIAYDLDTLLQNDGENHLHYYPVTYSKKPPSIGLLDIARSKQNGLIKKFAFHKSKRWEYEKELRIVTSKQGLNSYYHTALKSIYFGLNMTESDKTRIIELLKGRAVNYYQIQLERNSYKFKAIKVENDSSPESTTYLRKLPIALTNGKDVEFEVLQNKIHNYAGIGEFKVLLKQELNKTELSILIEHLKKNLFTDGNVLFFEFFKDRYKMDELPWATAETRKEKTTLQMNTAK